jgi:hypothetical protein
MASVAPMKSGFVETESHTVEGDAMSKRTGAKRGDEADDDLPAGRGEAGGEKSEATAEREKLEDATDDQATREREARAQAAREGTETPVTGRAASELDPRRVEGSDPELRAAKKVGMKAAPPAADPATAEKKARTAKDLKWADDLIAALAETGTGHDKLDVVRRAKVLKFDLGENYGLPEDDPNHDKRTALKPDDPKRHLTAKQALAALEADPTVGEVTKEKARAILKSGTWKPGATGPDLLDAKIPPPPKSAPPASSSAGADGETPAPKKGARPAGHMDLPPEGGDDGLDDMTVAELRGVADDEKVELESHAHKADIVAAIRKGRKGR